MQRHAHAHGRGNAKPHAQNVAAAARATGQLAAQAPPALILFTTSVGQPIVLYVAALGNVDQSLVEAAEVDGATKLQTFWRIKWPSIMPTTLYVLVITTINTFQCFSLVQLLTSGGPQHSTDTVMYYLYTNAFSLYKYGYANSMGVVLAIIIAILSAIQFKVMSKDVEY